MFAATAGERRQLLVGNPAGLMVSDRLVALAMSIE